jgi:subtilisin family serine protease
MNVPAATTTFHVTGAGIRIGILSDSFDAQGLAVLKHEEINGDLPPTIDILSDYTGPGATDEGRAMAEVVHAVARGAAIDFATAYSTDQQFADGILALAAAGCNIIVDDVTYFDEPFFEDSNVIQQAVQTVIAEGVSYFTAASNEGTNFYEHPVDLAAGTLPNGTNAMLEDFGATAASHSGSDTLQDIAISAGTTLDFDLQWTQPFLTDGSTTDIGPGSAYSLALYLFNGTTLAASATIDVTGGDPVQVLQFAAGASGTYQLAIAMTSGIAPTGDTLKYIVYESYTTGSSLIAIKDSNAGQGSGDITGHELVAGVNTVGAVNAANPTTPEAYSSYGPGTLDTYSATGVLTGTTVENKPDILAPDGISTSVSGFSQFFGTSAAAPDAAAVAALMLQANPNLTPAQVTAALEGTATTVDGPVNQVGAVLANADAAVQAVNGDVWTRAAGGTWDTAAAWSADVPGAGNPATLSNDFGTLTASYTVTVNSTDAVADTLTVGNATPASVTPKILLAIAAGERLNIAAGATVTQHGTLSVAGSGTLTVGGIAELTDATAMLTLSNDAVMTTAVLEIGAGSVAIGSGANLTASGSVDLEIEVVNNTGTTYVTIPYGLATGGGTITVDAAAYWR